MASRDKKVSLSRKQSTASPVPPREGATPPETLTKSIIPKAESSVTDEAPKLTSIRNSRNNPPKSTSISRKIRSKSTGKVIKKNISLKAKNKTKLNQKIGKKLLSNTRSNFEVKQSLLRNGIKAKVARKTKPPSVKKEQIDDNPPVLEPIYPINDNVKQAKKKPKKLVDEDKKIKEESNDSFSLTDETIDSILNQCNTQIRSNKKRVIKKIKSENLSDTSKETIDDVINDLTTLIKTEEIKTEVDSDLEKLEIKSRRPLKSVKLDLLKKLKKENIENKFEAENKVIDMLDLNVAKRRNKIIRNRRHSIEKYPIGCVETSVPNLSVFTNIPRSISPRTKRTAKVRQSIELNSSKRSSPYSTRSESPAGILRNGKHRKLKDMNLLEGLDTGYRKRRRLCSDYSGSEISVSKSGYESDSSFSDLASLHGAENNENFEVKLDIKRDIAETTGPNNDKSSNIKVETDSIKKCLSMETEGEMANEQKISERDGIDTNSNVCETQSKLESKKYENKDNLSMPISTAKVEECEEYIDTVVSPSAKVPEKSIILDIMKQTFNNDVNNSEQDKEKRATRSSTRKVSNIDDKETNIIASDTSVSAQLEQCVENDVVDSDNVDNSTRIIQEPEEINEIEERPHVESEESTKSQENSDELLKKVENEDIVEHSVESENDSTEENTKKVEIVETPESLAIKESILQALGLQSLRAAEEAKLKTKDKIFPKNDSYTGTLKTVIKLNRNERRKGKNSLKMTLQKNKKNGKDEKDKFDNNDLVKADEDTSKHIKESGLSSTWKSHGSQSSDTAGALRKSHYANRSNMDASSEHTSDGDTATAEEGTAKSLVIPEKASSFSIHPGRLCKDECSYCFGKFGLFDTPCHIAQMKSVERQNKILAVEKHLTRDSCLCDACYRHVDRKTNTPSYANNKAFKRNLVTSVPKHNFCHVLGCKNESTTNIRRKWAIKIKNICKVITINLDNPGLHLVPICEEHFNALEHLMTCAMCKRKLARNHIHYLGQEASELSEKLNTIGIPVKFNDKPVICKFCKYFATLMLTNDDERPENSAEFYKEYTKRLLHYHDVEHMDEAEVEEPIPVPTKDKCDKDITKKKKKIYSKSTSSNEALHLERQTDSTPSTDNNNVPSSESRAESPDFMVDYNTLIPNIALECGSDAEKKELPKKQILLKKIPRPESVKEAVEISKNLKLKNKSDIAVQRLGSNPSISVRQLFPGEEDLPLQGNIEFHNIKERTPEGWEKCASTIQFDLDTKHLWQELQKPYGNQSSFLRHLILLEKYFRNGDLILSANASHHSVNYSESVQNRLRAYDNTPSNSGPIQPLSMIPFNKPQKSSSGIITSNRDNSQNLSIINAANIPKNTPITITQLNNSNFVMNSNNPNNNNSASNCNNNNNNNNSKQKLPGVPPGLMPLQPGTSKPVAPLVKVPQPQKIKFPITKNWRPNLIPIDPAKKPEKKPGLVQVISGGKPYHITVEDYKKMCAIKRTFDLKQKKLQDAQKAKLESQKVMNASPNSLLKAMAPRKSLIISKTSTITNPRIEQNNANDIEREESSLDKLDKQVEKLEAKFGESKSVMILPKIPKSLTVIPQTVTRKPSRPSSPALQITPKPKIVLPSPKS